MLHLLLVIGLTGAEARVPPHVIAAAVEEAAPIWATYGVRLDVNRDADGGDAGDSATQ